MNLAMNMQNANQMFQKRPFGLGGTNLAQSELGQAGAYNSFQQSNYATMNGIAFNQAQMAAQQQQLQSQQTAGMVGAGVSMAGTAVSAATVATFCWVARAIYNDDERKWKHFRHWLVNKAPANLRRLYLRHGRAFAPKVRQNRFLCLLLRFLMDQVINQTTYVGKTFSFT
jgi:hypothetical protein